jgi:hypothetical protein
MKRPLIYCLVAISTLFGKESWLETSAIHEIAVLEQLFTDSYAPLLYKEEKFSFDLSIKAEKARQGFHAKPPSSLQEARLRIIDFANRLHDYHVLIHFMSTAEATLPFHCKLVQGHLVVASVETHVSGLLIGDEILSIDGHPIGNVIQELRAIVGRNSNPETDNALVEQALTYRVGALGMDVPKGKTTIGLRRASDPAKITKLTLAWATEEEKIMPPYLGKSKGQKALYSSPYDFGSKQSQIAFDGALWKTDPEAPFQAALFDAASKKIGFMRIPEFDLDGADDEDLDELLEERIAFFEANADILVIDVMNNRGGDIFDLYNVLSHFASTPLEPLQEKKALTQAEVFHFLQVLELLEEDDPDALDFGSSLIRAALAEDLKMKAMMMQYCHFLLDEWSQGRTLTNLHYPFFIDKIEANKAAVFTKPLLILTNELTMSSAEIFCAILRMNNRAQIIGVPTAGAGGSMTGSPHIPNLLGIDFVAYTSSILFDNKGRALENVGIKPDIYAPFTYEDLLHGGSSLKRRILDAATLMHK